MRALTAGGMNISPRAARCTASTTWRSPDRLSSTPMVVSNGSSPFQRRASRIDVGLCTGSPIREHHVADIDFCHEFFVMPIAHMPRNPL